MKYIAYYIIPLLFCAACKLEPKKQDLSKVNKLPAIKLLALDSLTSFDPGSSTRGKVLIYFSPDCEHCQKMTKELLNMKNKLSNADICYITLESIDQARQFNKAFNLETAGNWKIGIDYQFSFYKNFLPPGTPYILIYNQQNKLVRLFDGEVDPQYIINAIED